jgi:hypothetical protein
MSILKSAVLLALLGVAASHSMVGSSRDVRRNRFGAMEIVEWAEEGMQKQVMWPLKSFAQDYVQQAEFLKEA